jgi:TonB family protein
LPAIQPVVQALPVYPDDLVRKGIDGLGRYRISIDKKGAVQRVEVKASVHPFLDAAAVEAMSAWVFEPVKKGLEAVGVSFFWTIDFDPSRWPGMAPAAELDTSEPPSPELEKLLGLGAAYCERLSAAALDFVCREQILSLDCALHLPKQPASTGIWYKQKRTDSGEMIGIGSRPALLSRDPFKTKKLRLSSDFQLVRKQGRIEERRRLLESNDKTARKGVAPPDEERYAGLRPLFVPIDILGKDLQGFYRFRLIRRDRIQGRVAAVVEALAKPGAPVRITAAKIWIDPESSQVLRCETQGLPIEGYKFIFDEASLIGVNPVGTTAISYETEKNGIVFPSRVKLLIEYPVNVWGVGKRTRIDTDIRYDQYRFFTVETEKAIIR